MSLRFNSTLYINKGGTKKLYKLYTNPTFNPASHWFSVSCEMYSLCSKLYTNYTLNPTLNPTQRAFQTLHSERSKPYIEAFQCLHWDVQNTTQNPARNLMLKFEKPFPLGRGWGRLRKALPFREGLRVGFRPKKSNNFERFFGDLTLTFLTYRNTFLLPILPTRRIILLCLPLIKIRRRQILTGCAPNFSWERS